MIVVDASVLVNAVVKGPSTEEVIEVLRRKETWVAPALWRSEVRSALVQHIRHGAFSSHHAFKRVLEAEDLVDVTKEMREHDRVLTVAVESGCSVYDSEYVSIALETGLPLLTYDRRLIDRFPDIAMSPGDWLKRTEN